MQKIEYSNEPILTKKALQTDRNKIIYIFPRYFADFNFLFINFI